MVKKFRFTITNWQKYNGEKRGGHSVSWLRFNHDFFDQPEIMVLDGDTIKLWLFCLTLCSKKNTGSHTLCVAFVQSRTQLSPRVQALCFTKLHKIGWLTRFSARAVADIGARMADNGALRNDTIRNETIRYDTGASPRAGGGDVPPWDKLVQAWNENRGTLPKATKQSLSRIDLINQRLGEEPDLEVWVSAIKRVSESDFCNGRIISSDGKKPWVTTFGWLVKPDSRMRIEEGTYDNRSAHSSVKPPAPGVRIPEPMTPDQLAAAARDEYWDAD